MPVLAWLAGCGPGADPGSSRPTTPAPVLPSPTIPTGTTEPPPAGPPYDEICPQLDWLVHVSSTLDEELPSIELSPDGAVVVAVQFGGAVKVGTGPHDWLVEECSLTEAGVAKIDYRTGALRWSRVFGSCLVDQTWNVAVDESGGVAMAGSFASDLRYQGKVVLEAVQPPLSDAFVATFDPGGDLKLLVGIAGEFSDRATAVALEEDGGFVAGGWYRSMSLSLGGTTIGHTVEEDGGSPGSDIFLASFDSDGTPEWLYGAGGTADDSVLGLRLRGTEVLAATELRGAADLFLDDGIQTPLNLPATWAFVQVVDLDTGAINDIHQLATSVVYLEEIGSNPADALGYTVIGSAINTVSWTLPTETVALPSDVLSSAYFGFHDAAGNATAIELVNEPLATDDDPWPLFAYALGGSVGAERTVIAGISTEPGISFGVGTDRQVDLPMIGEPHDAFAATFTHDGDFRCAWGFRGTGWEDASDAVMDPEGGVIVVGMFDDTLEIVDGEGVVVARLESAGNGDGFIVRFAPVVPLTP